MEKYQSVEAVVQKWLARLGLSDWIVEISIRKGLYNDDENCEACITDNLKYRNAHLEIWKPYWKATPQNQEKYIVHELTHLLFSRLHPHLSPSGDDQLEEAVQSVAMQFYFAWKMIEQLPERQLTPAIGFQTYDE